MNKLQFSKLLMIGSIFLIAAFQLYWLMKLYKDERQTLGRTVDVNFRETMYKIQADRLKADTSFMKKNMNDDIFLGDVMLVTAKGEALKNNNTHNRKNVGADTIMYHHRSNNNPLNEMDAANIHSVTVTKGAADGERQIRVQLNSPLSNYRQNNATAKNRLNNKTSITQPTLPPPVMPGNVKDFVIKNKTINDSIPIKTIDSAYKLALAKNNITIDYSIVRDSVKRGRDADRFKDSVNNKLVTSLVPVGFFRKMGYRARFEDPTYFVVRKISPQIILSLLLLALTSVSFIFLYRNLLAQRKLTAIKNEFISNITHELKTPIATVNVAIEALRSFGGLENPERTKEYLDISVMELQRLSLLVDKVLKLSMFENKEISLQKESFDMVQLAEEVIASMKLQFEKQKAEAILEAKGTNFVIEADKLHITSVIYNLLDNALKYSKEKPQISIQLIDQFEYLEIRVSDSGIGIPNEYKDKIFEQFFRVPSGDKHDIKGYGLGLSYVSHIVQRHNGFIKVESELGKGSTFIVKLPV